jgi:hypothetical protein
MRASGGPALEGAPAAGGAYHASQMRPRLPAERGPQATLFHPFLRLDARTGSLRLPPTICSPNFRDRTLEVPKPLSEVSLSEDEMILEGFEATLGGTQVLVTAVLERTCVYVDPAGERKLASKQDLLVDPEKLTIRRRRPGS